MTTFFEVEGDLYETLEDAKRAARRFTTGYCTEYEAEESFEDVRVLYDKERAEGNSIEDCLSHYRRGHMTWNK